MHLKPLDFLTIFADLQRRIVEHCRTLIFVKILLLLYNESINVDARLHTHFGLIP